MDQKESDSVDFSYLPSFLFIFESLRSLRLSVGFCSRLIVFFVFSVHLSVFAFPAP